jgi:hypothetical protein
MIKANYIPTIVMEVVADPEEPALVVTNPVELAKAEARRERFIRNWEWFRTQIPGIYEKNRGRYFCVAGQELFVADTVEEVLALATEAHPEDDGRFAEYIPRERKVRIY